MRWYAVGAVATVALLVGLVAFVIAFPQREPDLSQLCRADPAKPHLELRNVTASRTFLGAVFVVANPTGEEFTFLGGSVDAQSYRVLRDGSMVPGIGSGLVVDFVENYTGQHVPPGGEAPYEGASLNGTFAPGRYALAGLIDGGALCGVARADVA